MKYIIIYFYNCNIFINNLTKLTKLIINIKLITCNKMSNTQTLFMYRNCGYNKGYESPMKERNPAKKIKTMTKNIDINLNMFNKKSHNNDDYKIKNYDDENIFDKPHNHPHADRNNIFKSNLIKRVIDPGITVHRNHDARAAERIVESKFQNNQYNGYDFFTRSKVSDSIRDKITLMSTEFTSTLNRYSILL